MFATDSLPDSPALLKALVSAQQAEIEHLKFIIAKFRRMQFGRRSEQMDDTITQLELALEELECVHAEQSSDEPAASEEPIEPATESEPTVRAKPKRKPLPDHLPRESVEHLPVECCCPDCGGALKKLGEDIAEVLEYVPASFRVIQHVRPKLACAVCDVIVQAAAPSRPIARGMAGPGLLAHVLVAKYCDHLPLYPPRGLPSGVGRAAFTPARASNWNARHWPAGSVNVTHCYGHWSRHFKNTCSLAISCTPMTPRCRYLRRVKERQRPVVCGRMCGMIDRRARKHRLLFGLLTRRIDAANIRRRI